MLVHGRQPLAGSRDLPIHNDDTSAAGNANTRDTASRRGGPPQTEGRRSLWPKEHGAYGQLAMPLVTGLCVAQPSVATAAFVAVGVSAFLLHEPTLVLLGQRGTRALREEGPRARRWMGLLGTTLVAALATALLTAPPLALASIALSSALAGAVFVLVLQKREKTTAGELLAAAAMCSLVVPVTASSGLSLQHAFALFVVWWAAFSAATLAVRGVIARARGQSTVVPAFASCALVTGLAAAALLVPQSPLQGVFSPFFAVALLPGALAAQVLALLHVAPKHLRRVGWSLMASSMTTLTVLMVVVHG